MKLFSQYLYENSEEYRQLDELSSELIGRYLNKSKSDESDALNKVNNSIQGGHVYHDNWKRIDKRLTGQSLGKKRFNVRNSSPSGVKGGAASRLKRMGYARGDGK